MTPAQRSGAAPLPAMPSTRNLRIVVGVGAAAMTAIGLVVLFLLTQATRNRELYERNYQLLFAINIVVAVLLLSAILWTGARLLVRLYSGRFGSRLLVKLAAIFALVGFLPGVLIYTVSYQFVSRSIESWFDVKVEGALEAGLNLGRNALDALASDLGNRTRQAALQLGEVPDAGAALAVERLRDQLPGSDISLWTSSGQLIARAGTSRFQLGGERPPAQQVRQLRTQRVSAMVEGLDEAGLVGTAVNARIRAVAHVSSPAVGLMAEPRLLQVIQDLPPALAANAVAVQEANREYQERALGREGLRRMYIGTLTLSLFLAVFGAILLAILLGNQLARPLLLLAEGVRQVASGDLSPKAALQGKDELGGLTRSFADMTQQLSDARTTIEASIGEVSAARANLQTILDNLTAGVIVLDSAWRIRTSNPGATRILRAPLAAHEGKPLVDVPGLAAFAAGVRSQFEQFFDARDEHAIDHWQQSFEIGDATGSAQGLTLVARGAVLPGGDRLLVFDDISEIVSAQRARAWGEVARRLAHEIKNPLTPIQLSAERLEMKLASQVDEAGGMLLSRSVKTIVDQVDAMKRLVNEFRDYARLPAAELKRVDLNALVEELLQMYDAGHEGAAGDVPVRAEIDGECPPVLADPQQLRQILHNLVQNAQDATPAGSGGDVCIRTQWLAANRRVRLSVLDRGSGFPEAILKRAFEPYVTTKAKGTGLGLAVVKKIADDHDARVDVSNRPEGGAQVSLSFPVAP